MTSRATTEKEAEKNQEAARLWISGLEAVNRTLGLARVLDLSATPFFLRGSGHVEGMLFPWTMSDFPLMDAIECGIVKLPRVPVADNIPGNEMPMFRNLWEHIGKNRPRAAAAVLRPERGRPVQRRVRRRAGHEHLKAHMRARVEHPFRVIKRQFGYRMVRYRGLAKNAAQVLTLFALSNLWMKRRILLAMAG